MRPLLARLATALAAVLLAALPAAAIDSGTPARTLDDLTVYEGPGVAYDVLGSIADDTRVRVDRCTYQWCQVHAAGINGWFKHVSTHSCPWSLTLFGGEADYFRMLAPLPAHPGSGGCSPSGHAGNGFMWIAAVYAAALWRPAWTRPLAVSVAVFGTLCAAAQIVRGAHFLSHVLLALALCGGVSGAAWLLVLTWRQRSAS